MDISFNPEYLISKDLTIMEFLALRNLVVKEEDKIKDIAKLISPIDLNKLDQKGFIKKTSNGIELREKTYSLFQPEDLFDKFLTIFPLKTASGRYLSIKKLEGTIYDNLKKKWNRIFKNNTPKAEKAIKVLEAEITWRINTGQSEYMNAIEAWLNMGNYEKYEYLLDENLDADKKGESYNDWL